MHSVYVISAKLIRQPCLIAITFDQIAMNAHGYHVECYSSWAEQGRYGYPVIKSFSWLSANATCALPVLSGKLALRFVESVRQFTDPIRIGWQTDNSIWVERWSKLEANCIV